MTTCEKIKYLTKYGECLIRIKDCLEELQKWRDIGTDVSSKLVEIHSGGSGNKIENASVQIVYIQEQIKCELDSAGKLREQIEKSIDKVILSHHRVLLRKRFINCKSINEIANDMNRTPQSVYKSVKNAILKLDI